MLPRPGGAPLTQRERLTIQRQTEDEAVLRAYRLLHGVAVVLVPVFWLVYRHAAPEAYDPLGMRLALTGLSLTVLGLSYVSAGVRRHIVPLTQGFVYLLTLWILVLTQYNGFPANYAVGFYFLVSVGGIAIGLNERTVWPFVTYFAGTLTVTTAVMLAGPEPEVDAAVYFFCLLGTAMVITTALRSRAQAHEALRSSEAHLSEAQRIARLGNWEWDTAAGRAWWSAEAALLLGREEPEGDWPAFLALLHPESRREVEAWRVESGPDAFPRHLRLTLPDGSERVLAVKVEVLPDDDGRPRYVLGTCLDVTEQKRREAELDAAKEKAEAMNRLKDAFLANMSHEIRTPLTAVIGYAEVLAEEVGPRYENLAGPIVSGGRRLLDTLDSVLELARLEAGEQHLAIESVDAGAAAAEAVRLLTPLAAQKGLSLHAHLPPVPTHVMADPDALSRVLHNLIGNAVKFTERGHVRVSVEAGAERVAVAVTDTGVGISAAFLPHIFEEFKQESEGYERSHEGSGLGLTLTRRLVDLMGGTISVESTPGVGSTFTVSFPAAAAPADGMRSDPSAVHEV